MIIYLVPFLSKINKLKKLSIALILISFFSFPLFARNTISLKSMKQLISNKEYKKARDKLEDNKDKYIKNSEYYFLLGRVYQELKSNHRAFKAYTRSIFLEKNNFKSFLNRGMVKGALGDFDGAFEDLNKANKIQPNKPEYFLNLGIVYASLNKPINSIESFLKAINLDKNYHDAYNNLGITYYHQNDIDLACETWQIPADKGVETSKQWIKDYCNEGNK